MGRLHGLLVALFLVGAVAPHAIAQTDAEFQPLRDWIWSRAGATWAASTDATQERLLVTGLARSRDAYGDFVLRFEYRVPGPAAGGELLVRSTFGERPASRHAYAVTLTKDRSRGRITAVGQKLGDTSHQAPTADLRDGDWVACEVRAAGDALTVRLDGADVATADRLDIDRGLLAFRANGPGALELRGVRIAHVPVASAGQGPVTDGTVVFPVGDPRVKPTAIVYKTQPRYTAELMRQRIGGLVRLGGVVGTDGLPRNLRVGTAAHPDLVPQALACVRQWRFSPATKDGVPVAQQFTVEIAFSMLPPAPSWTPRK